MEESIIRKYYNKYLTEAFEFDKVDYQKNCYIITDQRTTKYFINPQKGTVDKYMEIGTFNNGYAIVRNSEGYNFINEQGELLSQEWFDKADDFSNGYAYVHKGNTANFIDTEGRFIFKEFQYAGTKSRFYKNGVAIVTYLGNETTIINQKGKKLLKDTFDSIEPFYGKYAVAIKKLRNHNPAEPNIYWNYEHHIIDCYGNDLKTKYKSLDQVAEGIFVAYDKEKGGQFLVDAKCNMIGDIVFDSHRGGFKDGYMLIKKQDTYNMIDKNGRLLFKKWYENIEYIGNGLFKVRDIENSLDKSNNDTPQKKYNFMTLDGSLLSPNWYNTVYNFHNGMAVVGDDSYRILYLDGTLSSEIFKDINEAFSYINAKKEAIELERIKNETKKELRRVHGFGNPNYEYPDGTLFFQKPKGLVSNMSEGNFAYYYRGDLTIYNKYGEQIAHLSNFPFIYNTATISLTTVQETPKLKKANSTKKWFHYSYEVDGRKYLLDYQPVTDYGDIIICEDQGSYYIYEKATLNNIYLGEKSEITLFENFIIKGDKKYFISGIDLIDVTELPFTIRISKKAGVNEIKTYEDFKVIFESPEYQSKLAEEIESLKESIEQEKKARLIEEANQKRESERQRIAEKKENLRQSLSNLSNILAECSRYITEIQMITNRDSNDKVKVPEELLLITVNDHIEINPIFLTPGILKFVDLSTISFKGVKITGIDLSYTNAMINPQEIYMKDMSNGKYCGLNFNLVSFKDVNIANADFTDAIFDFARDTEKIPRSK